MMLEMGACFRACDANQNGVLELLEFKQFMIRQNMNYKRRWGESTKGGAAEDEMWYKAYNLLTPGCDGISMDDFKEARGMLRRIICKKMFEPLLGVFMERMMKFRPDTQKKMGEAMTAEDKNPALYQEMVDEFVVCFKESDANGDGLLNCTEFKTYFNKQTDNMKKRFGEATKSDE
jgi:hypothetical protein